MEDSITAFDLHRMFLGDAPLLFALEVVVRTTVMYVYTVALVRLLGKRGLRQLSAFELVIIIALGSAVGDPMFYADVPLLHGMVVVTVIVVLEHMLAWGIERSGNVERLVESVPALLVRDGRLETKAIQGEHIAVDELFADLREAGYDNLADVSLAIIESSGNLSVFSAESDPSRTGLWLLPEGLEPPSERVATEWAACRHCGEVVQGEVGPPVCPRCSTPDGWCPAVRTPERSLRSA